MTSPPAQVTVECPRCGHVYRDWWRPSINLDLDEFDDAYLDKASPTRATPEVPMNGAFFATLVKFAGIAVVAFPIVQTSEQ